MPVETWLQLMLAVLAHEMTLAEAARRHGVSAESINRWRNRFVDVGKRRWKTVSHVTQLERRPLAPLDMIDCLAATGNW